MQTEVLNNGIVSLHKDTIDTLYSNSKDTLLFYVLLLSGYYSDMIPSMLGINDQDSINIQKYLSKKKLIKDTKEIKIKEKKTYIDGLHIDATSILTNYKNTLLENTKLVVYFYSVINNKKITSDVIEKRVRDKLAVSSFENVIEAVWRNSHNIFCNGGNSQKWKWDMAYLCREETVKSQPLQRSLERDLDIPVKDESIELLEKFIGTIPSLSYIKKIKFTYENSRNPKYSSEGEDILRKQREIKAGLGISIEDL